MPILYNWIHKAYDKINVHVWTLWLGSLQVDPLIVIFFGDLIFLKHLALDLTMASLANSVYL